MRRSGWLGFGSALAVMAGSAHAALLVGPWPVATPTEVMVLGTPHLSGIDALKPEWLAPLLDRLAAFKPRVITIEALSGPECDLMQRYEKSWPDVAASYCTGVAKLTPIARQATGLDMPQAEAAAEAALADVGRGSGAAEHRHLAALFAAAGNVGSAAVQWLRLPPGERHAGDGVDQPLAQALDALIVRRNENYLIGAALAARLGLERVYPVDDHLSDRIQSEAPQGQDKAMEAVWNGTRPPLALQAQAMEKALAGGADLLAYYRFMNRSDVGDAFVRADMGRAFQEPSAGHFGRRYVAWWETRNLHMVANIRAALGRDPGARGLVIVGATHKPYFDAYLAMMHEVRLVPAAQVLGK